MTTPGLNENDNMNRGNIRRFLLLFRMKYFTLRNSGSIKMMDKIFQEETIYCFVHGGSLTEFERVSKFLRYLQ